MRRLSEVKKVESNLGARCDDIKFLTGLGLDKSFVLQLVGQDLHRKSVPYARGFAYI